MEAILREIPSAWGPRPTIVGLYYVTAGPGQQVVHGPHYYDKTDAEALARWAVNAGKRHVTIRRSEDYGMTIPFTPKGDASWPPVGRQYTIRDGQIVTMDRRRS